MTEQEVTELHQKITAGVKAGIAVALEEHRRAGRKVPIWEDGQVKYVLPSPQENQSLQLSEDDPG